MGRGTLSALSVALIVPRESQRATRRQTRTLSVPPSSGTAPALFGEATADQTASCVEQPSVRPLNSHGNGFGKATSVILVAALGARYTASQRGTAACPEEAE